MEVTLKFKLANYLMRNEEAFAAAVAVIQANKTLPSPKKVFMESKLNLDNFLKYPETLVDAMYRYLRDDGAWKTMRSILQMSEPECRAVIDLHARGLRQFKSYDHCDSAEIRQLISEALWDLTKEDQERVKLFLSWGILGDRNIPVYRTWCLGPYSLTDQILAEHSDRSAYLMSLIFTQIRRPDLLEKLTAAAQAQLNSEAMPDMT